jgi:hypothetical protein
VCDDLRACFEDIFDIAVHDEIKISLSVSGVLLHVRFAIDNLRKLMHAIGEQFDVVGSDRELTFVSPTRMSANTNQITSTNSLLQVF